MDLSLFLPTVNLAAGLLIFFMGFVILRENPRSPVNRATSLMLFSGAVGSLLGALGQLVDPDAIDTAAAYAGALRTFSYMWEFFFPSLLYFALVFPVMHPFTRRMHTLEVALYVPYVLHLLMVVLLGDVHQLTGPIQMLLFRMEPGSLANFVSTVLEVLDIVLALMNKIHEQLFSLVNLAYAGVAMGLLVQNRRRTAVVHLRGQLAVVLLGLGVCVAAYLVAMLLATFFPFQDYVSYQVSLISIGLIVASIAIAYAIVRYKFLEMQNLARRSILYGGTALLFALLYLVIIRQVTRFSAGVFGANTEVIEAGFIVLAVIGFQPLLTAVEDLIENLIRNRDQGDSRMIISKLARELAAEVDLPSMRQKVERSLKASLLVQRVDLWTLETTPQGITLDSGSVQEPVQAGTAFAVLLDSLAKAPQQILRADLERSIRRFGRLDTTQVQRWTEPYVLLVPLVKQNEVLGVLGLGTKVTGGRFHAEDLALLNVLSQQLTTAIENVRLVSENVQKRILDEEINLATQIQEGLLPAHLPEHPVYHSHAVSFSSKFVGGDYYDLFLADDDLLHLAIADVSGKGVPAALLMSSLRAALHSNVAHLSSPSDVVSRINRLMYESTAPEKFATFFYGVLNTTTHELVYANAGHNYPLLVRADQDPVRLSQGGLILGAFDNARYEEGRLQLQPGDTLFLYTDGVTEATDDNEEDFGEERLQALLCRDCKRPPRELVEEVLRQVRDFTHGADPADDVTMLVIQRSALQETNGHLR